ncbi:MAG: hypothetical protein Q9186_003709 [Xanthomendoza sp. 1 TL-2023]
MSASDLHRDDDKFRHDRKLPGEGRIRVGVSQRKPHCTIRRDNLKQATIDGERILIRILKVFPLGNCDDEKTQEDVPQIERQLSPEMGPDVARLVGVLIILPSIGIDAKRFLLVHIGATNRDGDGEDGDIGEVDRCKSRSSSGRSLEEPVQYAVPDTTNLRDHRVVYIQDDEEDEIQTVQKNQDPEEPRGGVTRKQERETTSRVVEQEFKLFPRAALTRCCLRQQPYNETKHARKACIADDNEECAKEKWHDSSLKGYHGIRSQGESKIVEH